MKKFVFILMMIISSQAICQVKSGLRFVTEAGTSFLTLKHKDPTIIRYLSNPPTETTSGNTIEEGTNFQPSSNFVVFLGSVGWQFNPYIFLGVGTGIKMLYDNSDGDLPVFADLRVTFLNKKISPTLALKGGYNISDNAFFDLSTGIRYNIRSKSSLLFNFAITNYRFDYTIITPPHVPEIPDNEPYKPGKTEDFVIRNFFLQFRTGLTF